MVFYYISLVLALFGGTFFGMFLAKLERSKATLKFKKSLDDALKLYQEKLKEEQRKDAEYIQSLTAALGQEMLGVDSRSFNDFADEADDDFEDEFGPMPKRDKFN